MLRISRLFSASCTVSVIFLFSISSAYPQQTVRRHPLITESINEENLVTLHGSTRSEVYTAQDLGPVPDDLQLEHIYLLMNRPPEQQVEIDDLIEQLHDQNAPRFHQWLTASQIAERFGAAEEDIKTVTEWLGSHGFIVNGVYRANGVIDFSGSAARVAETFHTQIHNFDVNGTRHIANISDPKVPAALMPSMNGVVSLNDFRPHPMSSRQARPNYTVSIDNSLFQLVVPGDLETIYNMNPLYSAGISGQDQTIVVLEDSDVFTAADWHTFRKTFGLDARFPKGSFKEIHPQPSSFPESGGPCADPGVNPDDSEAIADAEWATAAAPSAEIVVAACADTNTTFGGFIAMQNLLTRPTLSPAIVSISYGADETELGASFMAYINSLYELAVLQGVSVFVSSGDAGAGGPDQFNPAATHGIGHVNGFASTSHDVAVGGTDFGDTFLNENSTYWSSTNGPYFNSALSYIPEIPWNDSCASQLIALSFGFSVTYGSNGFCNSTIGEESYLFVAAGAGGPSSCAFGSPSIPNVVSGTCSGRKKPSYQHRILGNPRDGLRDIPDVSLFAGAGVWGHFYIDCFSDTANFGSPCVGPPVNWTFDGGTSLSSPIMAGIQSMVNQAAGERQGNPNFVYYALGASEYRSHREASCDATLGDHTDPNCVFYDVTLGDTDVNCLPLTTSTGATIETFNCYIPSGTNGVLSLSNASYEPTYRATTGWDFATGIGSVNAFNLVKSWPGSHLHQSGDAGR
jgi:subtilase family serine protease